MDRAVAHIPIFHKTDKGIFRISTYGIAFVLAFMRTVYEIEKVKKKSGFGANEARNYGKALPGLDS